jgi:hypothetical protein
MKFYFQGISKQKEFIVKHFENEFKQKENTPNKGTVTRCRELEDFQQSTN